MTYPRSAAGIGWSAWQWRSWSLPRSRASSSCARRPSAPEAHAAELAEIRAVVEGETVLFLGRDDFIALGAARLGRDHRRGHQLLLRRGRPSRGSEGEGEARSSTSTRSSRRRSTASATSSPPPAGRNRARRRASCRSSRPTTTCSTSGRARRDGGAPSTRELEPGAMLDCEDKGRRGRNCTRRRGPRWFGKTAAPVGVGGWFARSSADARPVADLARLRQPPAADRQRTRARARRRACRPTSTSAVRRRRSPVGEVDVEAAGEYEFTVEVEEPNAIARLLARPQRSPPPRAHRDAPGRHPPDPAPSGLRSSTSTGTDERELSMSRSSAPASPA